MKKILALSSVFALYSSVGLSVINNNNSIDDSAAKNHVVKLDAPELFVDSAEFYLKNGQKIYLGMEKLTDSNTLGWKKYYYKIGHEMILFYEKCFDIIEKKSDKNSTNWKSAVAFYDNNEPEFNKFLEQLKNTIATKPSFKDMIKDISSGASLYAADIDKKNTEGYVVYASKTPITGAYKFDASIINYTYAKLEKEFRNILMTVGVINSFEFPIYSNRGIFLNPINAYDKDKYPGLSMVLHGFSARVLKEFNSNKKYMVVSPLPVMQTIIANSFKPGELFIGTKDNKPKEYEKFPPKIAIEYSGKSIFSMPCRYIFYKGDKIDFTVPPLGYVFNSGLLEYLNAIIFDSLVNNFNQADFEGRRVALTLSNNNDNTALKPAAPQAQQLKPAALKPAAPQAQQLKPAALKPVVPNTHFLNELNNRLPKKQ